MLLSSNVIECNSNQEANSGERNENGAFVQRVLECALQEVIINNIKRIKSTLQSQRFSRILTLFYWFLKLFFHNFSNSKFCDKL